MKRTTLPSRHSTNRSNHQLALLLIPLVLVCFAVSSQARATCQDGCLTNNNTVLGDDALLNNTSSDNPAIGFNALFSNTTGLSNTAVGSQALFSNQDGRYNTAVGEDALTNNTFGGENTAVGYQALMDPATSSWNTQQSAIWLSRMVAAKIPRLVISR